MSTSNISSTSQPEVRDRIRQFILESFAEPKGVGSFADDDPLIERGIIDSLDIFRLVSFLEDDLWVRIDDQEINPEVLQNLKTIEELVLRKQQKTTGSR